MMPRRPNEITPREFVKLTGVHVKTVYRWISAAKHKEPSPFVGHLRRDCSHRYWINRSVIENLAEEF